VLFSQCDLERQDMRIIRWSVLGLLGLTVVGAVAVQAPAVQDVLMDRVILARMDNSDRQALFTDDALRLLVCGSASPLPAPDRARACIAVIAGGKFYVIDTGPGSWNRMALLRMPGERIGGVFFTHYHSDHIGDLGEFNMQTWVAGRPGPLGVYGPRGVERLVAGFGEAFALDNGYRVAHHGADMLVPENGQMQAHVLELPADGGGVEALRDGDLRVTMFPVLHEPIEPAVGYRFDYKGRSVVVSGDTRKDPRLAEFARGADVLAHEAQNQEMVARLEATAQQLERPRMAKIFADIPSYHTSPVEAAEIANAAQAQTLLLYHLTPPPPNRLAEKVFLRGVAEVRPQGVVLAEDGTLIELPLDSKAVKVSVLK
jgi:ribonuclease Z